MKIKLKIFSTFVLASMLLTVAGVSLFYYYAEKNLQRAAEEHLTIISKNKAAWLSAYFAERIKDVEFLSQTPAAQQLLNATDTDINPVDYLLNFQSGRGYSDLLLIKTDGEIWWSATATPLQANLNQSVYRDSSLAVAYTQALAGDRPLITDYAPHPWSEQPAIFLASPVKLQGYTLGVVALQLSTVQLDAIMQRRSNSALVSRSYLVGPDYLLRSDTAELRSSAILKQMVDTANTRACFASYREAIVSGKDYRGVPVLGSYAFVPEVNWCLLTEIDQAQALAPLQQLRWFYLVVGAALLLLSYAVASWLSIRISKPIVALERGTAIIAKGDLQHRVATAAQDEIGRLSRAFDVMTAAIRNSRREVDRKVKEQTKEIRSQQRTLERDHRLILDMLEQVKREKLTAEGERDKINAILQGIGDGVFFIDNKGRVAMFNQAAAAMSGFGSGEVIGKKYDHLLKFKYTEDRKVYHQFIEDTIKTGRTREMSHHVLLERKNGKYVPVNAIATLLQDEAGQVTGCVVVLRDMTREEKVEKMKTEFVSLASHQLRTPLSAMRWFIEMFTDGDLGKLSSDQNRVVQKIAASNERMIHLVNGLLNIARIESGRVMVEPQPADILKLTKSIVAELEPLIKSHNHRLRIKAVKLPLIKFDPKLINQVMTNFLSNAIKYTPDSGEITVQISRVGNHVKWLVKDNGLGIPLEQQDRIFKKFFRAYNVTDSGINGTGLGLYVVKQIVEASGGKVHFKSREKHGSSFWFTLPLSGSKPIAGEKGLEYFGTHG